MSSFIIRTFTEDDLDEVKGFFTDIIFRMPPFIGSEIPKSVMDTFASNTFQPVSEGLGTVAVDPDSGKIMGFLLCKELEKDKFIGDSYGGVNEVLCFADELMLEVRKRSKLFEKYPDSKMLDMVFIGVRDEYGKRGVGKALINTAMEDAKRKGFDLAIMEPSSLFSLKAALALGFEVLGSVRYDEFKNKEGKSTAEVCNFKAFGVHQEFAFVCKNLNQ